MNKKRFFSLFVILIFIIGLSNVFAQTPGENPRSTITAQTRSDAPINALHVQIKTTGSTQAANSAGTYGLDSTRFVGKARGIKINTTGAGNTNIAQGTSITSSGYIRFEDNANATSTGAFKFEVGDTIFLAIQSANRPDAQKLFGFANKNNSPNNDPPTVTGRDTTKRNARVGYNVAGSGFASMSFQFIDGLGQLQDSPTTDNMGTKYLTNLGLNSTGAIADSVIGIVIKATHPANNNTNAQLNLTDLYLAPTGKWLGGKIQAQDTLLVAYSKVGGSKLDSAAARGTSGLDTRNIAPLGGQPYYKLDTLGFVLHPNAGTGDLIMKSDSLWYTYEKTTVNGASVYTPATMTLPYTPIANTFIWDTTSLLHSSGDFYVKKFDSVAVPWIVPSGRQPISVRRGNSYWTYTPNSDPNNTNKVCTFYNNVRQDDLSDSTYIAGAPILFMSILPGDANFVRWNVGFGGFVNDQNTMVFDDPANDRIRDDGRLIPTVRRPNAAGHYLSAKSDITAGTVDGTAVFGGAHTTVDTVTRYVLGSAWVEAPDTLFIFDADSNISLDSITSPVLGGGDAYAYSESNSGTGTPPSMSGCWNVFGVRKYDTLYQPGRRIYNWGYDRSNDLESNRVRKIRLIAFLPGKTGLGQADTLNSAFLQGVNEGTTSNGTTDDFPTFSANYADGEAGTPGGKAIWITAGPIANMTVEWQRAGSGTWNAFPGTLTSSEAKSAGHRLRATLTDRCNNVVGTGVVAFKMYADDSRLDTLPGGANVPGAGLKIVGTGTPGHATPTTDTVFMFARASGAIDDRGIVQTQFTTTCQNNEIYFSFTAYKDSTGGGTNITGVSNPVLRQVGGSGDNTYKITISGSTTIASVMMSNSKNDFVRSAGGGWPTPDTALVAARSSCSFDEVEFKIQAIDDCGHPLYFTDADTGLVQFQPPNWLKGGWNSLASWKRKIPVLSDPDDPNSGYVYKANATTGAYSSPNVFTGTNFWGKIRDEASGYGTTPNATTIAAASHDTVGEYIDNGRKYVQDGAVYIKYKPANTSEDTVSIKVKAGPFEDESIIVTLSTEPGNFRLYTRGIGDTTFVASRGDVEDSTKTTYAYGVLRDCNNELVSSAYDANTFVYWRLLGTSRWSAFLFDPRLAYDLSNVSAPPFLLQSGAGTLTDAQINDNINAIKGYRGTRQLALGINTRAQNGRAYIGINSDTVGGSNSFVGKHVFPIERNNVFPLGTYDANPDLDQDSLYRMYAWNGTERWNKPYGLDESGNEVPSGETVNGFTGNLTPSFNGLAPITTSTINNSLRNNLRGYNELEASAYFYDGVNPARKLNVTRDNTIGTQVVGAARYRVVADQINQLAFVDGTGEYYDEPINSTDNQLPGWDFLNLYGRQAAKIDSMIGYPVINTNRRVIDTENTIVDGDTNTFYVKYGLGKNSWKGGRTYAGRIVPLYVRLYDKFGNPIYPDKDSVEISKGNNLAGSLVYNTDLMIPQLDGDTIYNQYFVEDGYIGTSPTRNGGYNATTRVTAGVNDIAVLKNVINYGKLRGTVQVRYQTLSHSNTGNTGGTVVNNVADDQEIIAKYVTTGDLGGKTLKDVAKIKSKPTGPLASYQIIGGNTSQGRVGIGNVIDWGAFDKVEDTYPESAKLVWYDYRYSNIPKVLVAADNKTGAPLIDLYPDVTVVPAGEELGGYAEIARVTSANDGVTGWGTNDRTYLRVKKHDNPTKFGDFYAKEYSDPTISSNNTGYLGGPQNRVIGGTAIGNNFGFLGGVGRIKLISRKADEIAFTIIDSVSYNLSLTDPSVEPIVGSPAKVVVLPGFIHWVAMANADAVNLEKEAVYPRPLRTNYNGIINLVNSATDPDNKNSLEVDTNSAYNRNPRSYAVPVDTVFVGQVYNIEARPYDRFGNRNTIDSIWVAFEHYGTGYWTDIWGTGSEFLLMDNERDKKPLADVKNEFHTIPNADNYLLPGIINGNGFDHEIRMIFRKKGSTQTTSNNIPFYMPDLVNDGSNSQIVAFRKLHVMKLEKPGGFDIISSSSSHNLVRLDDGYTISWTPAKSTNTFDDGIEYNVKFYDGSSYSTITDQSIPIGAVNIPYDQLTRDTNGIITDQTATLKSDALKEAIKLGYGHYNRNVKVVMEAKNKWGHTTNSSSMFDLDFELNKKPEAFKFNTIPSDLIASAAPFTFTWEVPFDSNGTVGLNAQAITSYSKSFNLDSLEYQVVFVPIEVYKGSADTARFNVGLPYGGTAATITKEFLTKALDSADGAKYEVYVVAKDRTTKSWDDPEFTTHSNTQIVTVIKAGNFARVMVDDVNKEGQPSIRVPVATDHEFTLIAADVDGNAIRGFASENPTVKLKLIALDRGNYPSSYGGNKILKLSVDGEPLVGDGTNGFTLPANLFVEGKVTITYNNTKSGIIYINVPNDNPVFKTIGEGEENNNPLAIIGSNTRDFITEAGPMDRLTVEVSPRQGTDVVFVHRPMQVLVSPADIYGNAIESVPENEKMLVTLSPRYPENFETGDFATPRSITGRTHYVLKPTVVQNDQFIQAFSFPDYSVSSNQASFKVLAHAPSVPTLTSPANGNEIQLNSHSQRQQFTWTKSTDPNNTSLVDLVGHNWNDADIVKYTVKVKENMNYVFPDSLDTDEVLWATGTTLYNLAILLGGGTSDKGCEANWYVIASDGLFETASAPSKIIIKPVGIIPVPPAEEIPTAFALGQNYPNPFNPTTNIQYDIPKASDVKIVIYNILGQPVRTLVNERKEAAKYNVVWDGKNDQGITVATGTYIYQIHAGEFSATKKMNLLK